MRFVVRPQLGPKPTVDHLLLTGKNVPIAELSSQAKRTLGVMVIAASRDCRSIANSSKIMRTLISACSLYMPTRYEGRKAR